MTAVLVFLGGMVGAPLRYLVSRAAQGRHDSLFPWGTLVVNVVGCFVLGVLTGAALSAPALALLGTGLCGALTTYSTFGYETFWLAEQRAYLYAAMNVAVSVFAGLGATFLGYALVTGYAA